MARVVIVTNIPSGHQVQLFDALHRQPGIDLHVLFFRKITPGRSWTRLPTGSFPHTFVKELKVHKHFYLNLGVFRALRRLKPDLIIVGQYASIAMQLVMYGASALKVPWVFWSERPGVEYTELPIFQSDSLRVAARKLALVPLRAWPREVWGIGQRATEHYGALTQTPTRNLPYYLDLSAMLAIERRPAESPVRFLYSGKMNTRKGFDLILEAMERLLAEGVELRLGFMGNGSMEDGAQRLAHTYPDKVTLLGFRELDEIPAILATYDVQLVASRYDGWGMVVPEGMAAGLAIICTRATGAAIDMIRHRQTGMLVEPGSADAIYEAARELAKSPALVAKLSAEGREAAKAYDASEGGKVMAQYVREALAR